MAKRNEGEVLPTYILWAHSTNKAGLHPVKIRLIHQRQPKYYSVMTQEREKLFLDSKTYQRVVSVPLQQLRGRNRELRELIEDAKQAAKDAIREVTNGGKTPFSFSLFERRYQGSESSRNLLASFNNYIERLQHRGQAGTARTYSSAYSALTSFLNGRDMDPAELTVKKLHDFDLWLRQDRWTVKNGKKIKKSGKNDTSISIYMRCIRAIYNELASNDDHLKLIYPFSRSESEKTKYKIPASGRGQKGQTLSANELNIFISGAVDGQEVPENPMYRAKQLFLFSFFAQGMNFKDMALLKYKNIGTDVIEFSRQKTLRTARNVRPIRIPLTDQLSEILVELGNPIKKDANYVFGVFSKDENCSEKETDDRVRQWIKTTNKWLRRFCEKNKIKVVSTYASRHSFASLAQFHVPMPQLSLMLGHSRLTTTQAYLGRFQDKQNRQGLDRVFGELRKVHG